ncbi:hypothetical protein PIB30_098935 [Stylosanthes scabra]|uniref:Uncharacterized protein n=1 Tax=Stylosanthes scabra TaxID=79078 RepID=A0ABU6YY47_9FABA|nr:hypothetical protein [Stylosanthes scabra]
MNGTTWKGSKLNVRLSKPTRGEDNLIGREKEVSARRKEICVYWCEEQKDRLRRSVLGVCVQPIDFSKSMNYLLDNWKGPGEIECRDVGPYRCLITFSSQEIKEEAMNDE